MNKTTQFFKNFLHLRCEEKSASGQKEQRPKFTRVYIPSMSEVHLFLIAAALNASGFQVEIMDGCSDKDFGISQKLLRELDESFDVPMIYQILGKVSEAGFDPASSAFLIPHWMELDEEHHKILTKILNAAGAKDVRFIRLKKYDENSAMDEFKHSDLRRLLLAVVAGDLLLRLSLHGKAHELIPGSAQELTEEWVERLSEMILTGRLWETGKLFQEMRDEFLELPMDSEDKKKVGISSDVAMNCSLSSKRELIDEIIRSKGEPVFVDLISSMLAKSTEADELRPHSETEKKISTPSFFALERFVEIWRNTARDSLKKTQAALSGQEDENLEKWGRGYEKGCSNLAGDAARFSDSHVSSMVYLRPKFFAPAKSEHPDLQTLYPEMKFCALGDDFGLKEKRFKNCVAYLVSQN